MTNETALAFLRKLTDANAELTLADRHRLAGLVGALLRGEKFESAAGLHWGWRKAAERQRRNAAYLALADVEPAHLGTEAKAEAIERDLRTYRTGRWRHDYTKGIGSIPEHEVKRRLWFVILDADDSADDPHVLSAIRIRHILADGIAARGQTSPELLTTELVDTVPRDSQRPRMAELLKLKT